jgi:prevent-host-death family protein
MVTVTGEQLQKNTGRVRAEARRHPVTVTYHGRPELVVLSVEEYELLRSQRKIAYTSADMPREAVERIAGNRMDSRHDSLDALLDD